MKPGALLLAPWGSGAGPVPATSHPAAAMAAKPEQWDPKRQAAPVTGVTGGIGYQAARALLPDGAVNVWAAQRRARRNRIIGVRSWR